MKIAKFIFIIFMVGAYTDQASAVSVCARVTNDTNTSCTSHTPIGTTSTTPDWTVTCTNTTNSTTDTITVKGIGICSNQTSLVNDAIKYPTIQKDNEPPIPSYCWCKMLSPATSKFVRVVGKTWDKPDFCYPRCAKVCAEAFQNTPVFRASILNGLSL